MDTFRANSSGSEFMYISSSTAGNVNLLNAGEIRDITDVPEPSTYAMMLAGLAVLGFCLRRRNAQVK